MELSSIFPSKYVKASDLKGREVTVVVARAEIEKLGDDNKLVIYFQGRDKGLVTNRTNADRIAYLYGTNTDGWVGKEIILYVDLVSFQGRTVEAIRVKPPMQRAVPTRQAPPQGQRVVTTRDGYELATGNKHPNAPTDDGDGDLPRDEIPF
jgi:hypothetical protein